MSTIRRAAAIGAFTAVVAVGAFGATAAYADPANPSTDTYTAVGSDTIQDVYNSFESGSHIASWNATIPGSSGDAALGGTIVPKNSLNSNSSNTAIGRPNGSGDGRKALSAAWNSSNHNWTQTVTKTSGTTTTTYAVPNQVIDIARSSGKPSTIVSSGASNDQLTSVPLARDAVSVATNKSGVASALGTWVFTQPELQAIYGLGTATAGTYTQNAGSVTKGDIQVSGTAGSTQKEVLVTAVSPTKTVTLNPILPQASSGTRSFFISASGGGTPGAWVNANHEENTASEVVSGGAGTVIPFSAAQYVWQYNNTTGTTGVKDASFAINSLSLGGTTYTAATVSGSTATDGTLFGATNAAPTLAYSRDVYSVVPSSVIEASSPTSYQSAIKTLVTATLPGTSNVTSFGFKALDLTSTSFYSSSSNGDWIHSPFEN